VDGTGAAPVRAEVAIAAGKVVAIGKVKDGAKRVIEAADLIVSPGFIDVMLARKSRTITSWIIRVILRHASRRALPGLHYLGVRSSLFQ
jgi:N-acyl-D-amino-acid deacylase